MIREWWLCSLQSCLMWYRCDSCDRCDTDVTQMWQMWHILLYLDLFHHLTLMDLLTTILVDVTQHPPEIAMAWWGPQLYTAPIFKCSKSSFSHLLAPCSSHKCICKWNCKEIGLGAKWEKNNWKQFNWKENFKFYIKDQFSPKFTLTHWANDVCNSNSHSNISLSPSNFNSLFSLCLKYGIHQRAKLMAAQTSLCCVLPMCLFFISLTTLLTILSSSSSSCSPTISATKPTDGCRTPPPASFAFHSECQLSVYTCRSSIDPWRCVRWLIFWSHCIC